jgi:hypothetical protein
MTQPYLPPRPQQHFTFPPPKPSNNGLMTAGFVVALCGAVLALIPLLGIVSWIVSPVGIVLSIVGLVQAGPHSSRGLGIAGVILGAVGLLICLLWAIGFAAASSPAAGSNSGSNYSAPRTSSYSTPFYSQSAPTTQAMPPVNGPFEDGTYLVGEELAAGSYRTDGAGGSCYWSRLEDTTGNFGSIAANGIVSGPTTITVQQGDAAVRFSGGCLWTRR